MANFRPRWKKVLHDLTDNKSRTVLVVVSIIVGVFSIGVITGAYAIISHDMSASYAAGNPANVEVRGEAFTNDQVSMVGNMADVKEAEGRRVITSRFRVPGSSQWITLNLIAIKDFKDLKINYLTPILGVNSPKKKEIVLEVKAAKELGVVPGDTLEIQLNNGTIKNFPVVGVVQDPGTGAGDFLASNLAYITSNSLGYINEPEIFNRVYATVNEKGDDRDYLRQMTADIKDKLEKSGSAVLRTRVGLSNEHPLAATVQAILGILLALGVLILFLSSSLIANTLNALLNQHLRHIGVIKLIGGRRDQVIGMYFVLILAFSAIALVIAVPLGGQGAYMLADFIASSINFQLMGYRIVPSALLIQIIVGLAIPLLAGLVPVLNGSRTTVLNALNSGASGREDKKHKKDEHKVSPWEHFQVNTTTWLSRRKIHIPRPLLISLRNTFRRKGRLMLTLFTLSMGGAIFIAVFNVRVSLNDYIDQIGHYFLADITLDFEQPYRLAKVQNTAMQVAGVQHIEGWAYGAAELLNPDGSVAENLTILAPPAGSKLVSPRLVSGRWLAPGDENLITVSESILKTYPDLKPGDSVKLKMSGKEDIWKVAGIFQFVNQEGTIAYANYEYLSKYTHFPNQSFSYRIVTANHEPEYQQMMADKLDEYFRDEGYRVNKAQTGRSTLKKASESLGILVTFLMIMALLTALVGSMGLTGTMGMNVLERTREIGIMRSIGAVDKVIMRTVIAEGALIGMISWGIGALLSIPFSYLLSAIVSYAVFKFPIPVIFTAEGFVIWLFIVLALSAIASILPARKAARLTIREVLAYE
jgi:putative ABC transport system permease protein